MRAPRPVLLVLVLSLLAAGVRIGAAPNQAEIAAATLQTAQALYTAGEYEQCKALVSRAVSEYRSSPAGFPSGTAARILALDALLEYTFREEGYAARIEALLGEALSLDLDLDIGGPAEVPAFVLNSFARVKTSYLARFSRTARRNTVGVSAALVLEPTVFQNLSLLQPGVCYTYNLSESWSLDCQLRFPLQLPIWNSIRGQLGIIYIPSYRVEKIATGISASYVFGLDNLSTYTHSITFGGRMELITRSGFGFAGNAELLRVDLVLGASALPQPKYTQLPFLGLVQVVFANITLFAFYAF